MKPNKHIILLLLTTLFILWLALPDLQAQCPMCRMSAESNLKDGGTAGKGLNTGILFLLSTPYLIIGFLGFLYWKNKKKASDEASNAH
ncbi:MAG TPA: hypothetical protein VJ917_01115 [Saprospiraceae bacterium]|nr:hypothetical protein [Saprospiraceae bacterium]